MYSIVKSLCRTYSEYKTATSESRANALWHKMMGEARRLAIALFGRPKLLISINGLLPSNIEYMIAKELFWDIIFKCNENEYIEFTLQVWDYLEEITLDNHIVDKYSGMVLFEGQELLDITFLGIVERKQHRKYDIYVLSGKADTIDVNEKDIAYITSGEDIKALTDRYKDLFYIREW